MEGESPWGSSPLSSTSPWGVRKVKQVMTVFDLAPQIKIRKVDELIDPPVTLLVNKFTEESAIQFAEGFNIAQNRPQPVIPVLIDSYGGQVYSLLSMLDTISRARKPVATVIMGKAMSCGAMLAAHGTEGYRFIAPQATVMIHDVSAGMFGKLEEIKSSVTEAARLHDMIFKSMARHVGQAEDYFLQIMHEKGHADWYLDSQEALQHKIVNHIRIPEFKVKLDVKVDFA